MSSIPLSVVKYLRALVLSEKMMTYLHVDTKDNLADWGGYPRHYGLSKLQQGQSIFEQVDFLAGVLPINHTEVLEFLQLPNGHVAHVHLIPVHNGTWVIFLDASEEHERQQKIQQRAHDLSLMSYQQSRLIQELENARQALITEKNQIEQANALKSRFIAELSHELRTPLSSIMGYTEIMEQVQEADKEEKNYLSKVKKNANHLLHLIDSVLNQSRLEAGQMQLQPSHCDMKQLCGDLRDIFFPTAEEKGLAFKVEMDNSVPSHLQLDELRLRQILINLLTNAFKFTKKGFIYVTLSWQDNDRLFFSVADSGPGIAPELQNKIFVAYQRDPSVQHQPGAGLGLSITHQLIKLMNGKLNLASSSDGSTFSGYINAPRSRSYTEKYTSEPNQKHLLLVNRCVLVVEDTSVVQQLLEIYVQEMGCDQIALAEDGHTAEQLAQQRTFDLIIMDMHLPGQDGDVVVEKLRAAGIDTPIIALSASGLALDREHALQVGCNAYLTKPFGFDELLALVKKLLVV